MARVSGELDMDCFVDNSRQAIEDFNETYWTPQQLIDARIGLLTKTEYDYTDHIPRWYNQPHYVEVWIEKDAMTAVFQTILEGLDVRIVPMKGNVSWTFLNECANRIKHFLSLGKQFMFCIMEISILLATIWILIWEYGRCNQIQLFVRRPIRASD